MKSLWQDNEAASIQEHDLPLRVYSSRLLGQNADLVLHGGGNTSVKSSSQDIFGREKETLFVKGSGWDLRTIEAAGFSPCDLNYLQQLATLESLSDSEMMQQLRLSLLDPEAPTPSVEAILHAIIPFKYVDHTHTDAVVAVSNTADGEKSLREIFADKVLILPYIMPGFVLARQVYQQTRDLDWTAIQGIFLMHHGLFTFSDEARDSYESMIELVSSVEDYLSGKSILDNQVEAQYQASDDDLLTLAATRQQVSRLAGRSMLASLDCSPFSAAYACLKNVDKIATRGPITPDHTIHTKAVPAILGSEPAEAITNFAIQYQSYFDRHADGDLTCLDPAPRFAIWKNKGMISYGQNIKRLQVISDISQHTIKAIQWGEALGGWQALPENDLFNVEYWELEQAKLKKGGNSPLLEGKVALVSGAASGIGKACVEELLACGACVLALDINPAICTMFDSSQVLAVVCDVTDDQAVSRALKAGILQYGGLDILISNAGRFTPSESLSSLSDEHWHSSLELNLSSHMRLMRTVLPYLKLGLDPSIVVIASKNVPAPGPGAAAYSVAKAGLTQLARVAAMELGEAGIRVNVLHPNAVFDTAVWDDATLIERAEHYGLTVAEYKQNNILKKEVSSRDVAVMARVFASLETACTTGAQIPVDGGNDRVI